MDILQIIQALVQVALEEEMVPQELNSMAAPLLQILVVVVAIMAAVVALEILEMEAILEAAPHTSTSMSPR